MALKRSQVYSNRANVQLVRRSVRCIQLNLHHSRAATTKFNQLITEQQCDLAFLQEPYTIEGKLTGITRKYKVFSQGNGKRRSAIVVVDKQIDAILISQFSSEDITVMEFTQGKPNFIGISIYMDITRKIGTELYKIDQLLNFAKWKAVILAIDSNARSKLWNDKIANKRGRIL